jgi:hypothetical protein
MRQLKMDKISFKKNTILKTIDVYVPFQLKDNFKKHFKRCKWRPISLNWEIPEEYEEKLMKYIAKFDMSNVVESIKSQHDIDTSLESLKNLSSELSHIKSKIAKYCESIASSEKISEQADNILREIEDRKVELEQVQAEAEESRKNAESKCKEVEEFVQSIVDIPAVFAAHGEMVYHYKRLLSDNKNEYYKAEKIIRIQHKKLNEAGFYCDAMKKLGEMNFNRPDRDRPDRYKKADFFRIKAIEED